MLLHKVTLKNKKIMSKGLKTTILTRCMVLQCCLCLDWLDGCLEGVLHLLILLDLFQETLVLYMHCKVGFLPNQCPLLHNESHNLTYHIL